MRRLISKVKGECARARSIASLTFEINRLIPATGSRPSVQPAQHLQLDRPTYVNPIWKEWNSRMRPMASTSTRRFVKVAPPTVHAGVGEALRRAYRMDGELRSLNPFDELLDRLD